MFFKIYPTDEYSDYGLNRKQLYMDEVKIILERHAFDFEIVENDKESYYLVNIDTLEKMVMLSEELPMHQVCVNTVVQQLLTELMIGLYLM